jgi:translation initiation factor IF-2
MSLKKKPSVKLTDILKKIDVPTAKALESLRDLGLDLKNSSSVIDESLVSTVEEHLKDISKTSLDAQKSSEEGFSIHLKTPIVVKTLADALGRKPNEIISALMSFNILANINQVIDHEIAKKLCKKLGATLIVDKRDKGEKTSEETEKKDKIFSAKEAAEEKKEETSDRPEDLVARPPVVTFLGHVDHGKTSLQDAIRKTNVTAGEAGGITQHIGASVVKHGDKFITFIDTPGHEAFTAMRARGAKATDIAVLVVAADDGFMPQTVEALSHAQAAKVPVIVAINKMDLPGADPGKILRQMQQHGLFPEEWGGENAAIKVSAIKGDGINELIERILLEAEMLQLKANPKRKATAVVLEASMEHGHGPVANVLVQNGTLKKGDFVLCEEFVGKIKVIIGSSGEKLNEVTPGFPAKIIGLSGVPMAGMKLLVCEDEKAARKLAENKSLINKQNELSKNVFHAVNLEDLISRFQTDQKKSLNVIIKADTQGSIEAIKESFSKLPSEKITVNSLYASVGAITENDILLSAASDAIIVGFHVRVNPGVNALAKEKNVWIRLYSIIYELIEDVKDALEGKLDPDTREKPLGNAFILKVFELSKGPKICGCMVENGSVKVGAKARVFRGEDIIYNGNVQSLRRFQDDVKEVKQGFECGIRLDNFADFHEGDKIQIYEVEIKKASL